MKIKRAKYFEWTVKFYFTPISIFLFFYTKFSENSQSIRFRQESPNYEYKLTIKHI